MFLGYPTLAVMSQRAEYNTMVHTIADDMTRKWIELRASAAADGSGAKVDKSEKIKSLTDKFEGLDLQTSFKNGIIQDGFFGRTQLAEDSRAAGKWNTKQGGSYISASVGTAIIAIEENSRRAIDEKRKKRGLRRPFVPFGERQREDSNRQAACRPEGLSGKQREAFDAGIEMLRTDLDAMKGVKRLPTVKDRRLVFQVAQDRANLAGRLKYE